MTDQIYKVRDPSGVLREIRGPAGATDEQVIAKAQELFGNPAPSRPEGYVSPEIANDPISRGARDAQQRPLPIELMRQVGLTGRAGLSGIGAGVIANKIGLPEPENAQERIVQDVAGGMAGAAGMAGLAGKLAPGAQGIAKKMADLLRSGAGGQVVSGASAGAAGGAARESGAGPMGEMGAALAGGVAPGLAGSLAKTGARVARNVVDPWLPGGVERAAGRTANAAAGDSRTAILNALDNPDDFVGGPVTAGEAAAKVGRAEFSGLQDVIKGRIPTDYDAISRAQGKARADALRSFGGTADTLAGAELNRANVSGNLYDNARFLGIDPIGAGIDKDAHRSLHTLMKRPALKQALTQAKTLASNEGINLKDASGQVVGLDYTKRALDDMILAADGNERRVLQALKDDFISIVDSLSPEYAQARSTFAAMSKPINQMKVGQFLEGKLTAPISDQGAEVPQRASMYAQALRDAPGTIKRSTGQPRYDELSQVLTPQQIAITENVGRDLGRSTEQTRLARVGAEKARELVGQIAPKAPAAGMFSPQYSVLRAVSNRLAGRVEGKSLDALAEAFKDPKELARVMRMATPAEKKAIEGLTASQRAALAAAIYQGGEMTQGY